MDKVEKLVKDLVDIALTNNRALAAGSFKMEDSDKLEEAILLNNYVLKTFTNLGEIDENITEDAGASSDEALSEDSDSGSKEGIKVTRTGNLGSGEGDI